MQEYNSIIGNLFNSIPRSVFKRITDKYKVSVFTTLFHWYVLKFLLDNNALNGHAHASALCRLSAFLSLELSFFPICFEQFGSNLDKILITRRIEKG